MGWKSKTFIAAGLVGYLGYRLYQKRDAIADLLEEAQDRLPKIQADLDRIQDRLRDIQAMTPTLEKAGRDLDRHVQHYQKEKDQRLATINRILDKYVPED